MKVCLIYPPSYLPASLTQYTIPLGIYVVASILKENGIAVTLLDQFKFDNYLKKKVQLTKENFIADPIFKNALKDADILGLSTDSFNYSVAKIMISSARQINKGIKIILGGVHPTILDEHVIRTSGADLILRGEAEGRIIEVLHHLHEGKPLTDIQGITYKGADGSFIRHPDAPLCSSEQLSEINQIDYQLISQLNLVKAIPVETSRGCLYKCKFCSVLYKGKRRLFPLEKVKQNILAAYALKDYIFFTDDCLSFELDRAATILSFINGLDRIKLVFFEARVNDLANENSMILQKVNKEKVGTIQIGVECGYDEGLKRIKKGITTAQVEKACAVVAKNGFSQSASLSFIIGFPWEGVKECLKTIDFAVRMKNEFGVRANLNFWLPAPSEVWRESKSEFGVDERIYDDLEWSLSDDIFYRTHPLINAKDRRKLDFLRIKEGVLNA